MLTLNKIQLCGRLASDPETKTIAEGKTVTSARLAVNDTNSTQDRADFVTIEVWNGRGEALAKHLAKGRPVYIEGRLRIDQYEKDGAQQSFTKVVVDEWRFVDNKPSTKEA